MFDNGSQKEKNMIKRYRRVGMNDNSRGKPNALVIVEMRTDGYVGFGWARCSEKDNFQRKKANLIARGRLNSGRYILSLQTSYTEQEVAWCFPGVRKSDSVADLFDFIQETLNIAVRPPRPQEDKTESVREKA
jgi:hypothetical protein